MRMGSPARWAALAGTCLFASSACQTTNTTTPPLAGEVKKTAALDAKTGTTQKALSGLESVYFDYDRWELREDARLTLKENAKKIQSNSSGERLVIEGHCDERGSQEYNLALGERRAANVARYLEDLGVPGSRMQTVSFGEERPAVRGHDESAWRLNRRSEIRIESRTASR